MLGAETTPAAALNSITAVLCARHVAARSQDALPSQQDNASHKRKATSHNVLLTSQHEKRTSPLDEDPLLLRETTLPQDDDSRSCSGHLTPGQQHQTALEKDETVIKVQ